MTPLTVLTPSFVRLFQVIRLGGQNQAVNRMPHGLRLLATPVGVERERLSLPFKGHRLVAVGKRPDDAIGKGNQKRATD
jgi:hypothetical protein